MRIGTMIASLGCALALAGCQSFPSNTTVAEYCADPDNAQEAVCQLNVEIDGQKTALADTNMRLSQARAMADSAQAAADDAAAKADAAMARADSAMLREDQLYCETRTIQKTDTGSCDAGYKLMSCTQTRYTHRAGGLSFLREINDQECRFNSRVLEMQVRCCMAGSAPIATTPVDNPVEEVAQPTPEFEGF
ncbi:MAG: hypothetical protein AAF719_11380 [Pseudomonadota bacterium]